MPNIALELGQNAASLGVKSAYGDTQEVDVVPFVPVALTFSGFGGGDAKNVSASEGDASGGGGGGVAIPLGAYIHREEGLRFEPNFVALLAVTIPFVWVAGRALSRVIRALKK